MAGTLRSDDLVEDVEWMLRSGETHPAAIAARTGISLPSLRKALRRAGRPDLADQLTTPRPKAII